MYVDHGVYEICLMSQFLESMLIFGGILLAVD